MTYQEQKMMYQEQILKLLDELAMRKTDEGMVEAQLNSSKVKQLKCLLAQVGAIPMSQHPDYPFK